MGEDAKNEKAAGSTGNPGRNKVPRPNKLPVKTSTSRPTTQEKTKREEKMMGEDNGAGKYRTRMTTETAHEIASNKTRKMHPCEKLKHKKPQAGQRSRKETTRRDPLKKRDKNMPTMNQTH